MQSVSCGEAAAVGSIKKYGLHQPGTRGGNITAEASKSRDAAAHRTWTGVCATSRQETLQKQLELVTLGLPAPKIGLWGRILGGARKNEGRG
jgi:hypothetical protein